MKLVVDKTGVDETGINLLCYAALFQISIMLYKYPIYVYQESITGSAFPPYSGQVTSTDQGIQEVFCININYIQILTIILTVHYTITIYFSCSAASL